VGHWKFDEGKGTTARDSSGKGNDGNLKGGVKWVKGRIGGALEFRGGDQHVDAGTGRSLRNGRFAVAAWVKVEAYPLKGMANIVGKYRPKSRLNNIALRPDGRARTAYYAGDWKDHVGGKPLPKNRWNHVVSVVSPPHVSIYLNGDLDGSRHDAGALSLNDGPLVIGGEKGYWPFSGLIDDVRIYNRALSAEEVKALYREAERLAAQEASTRAQEKARAGLESLFARVEALLEKGDHAGAKRLMDRPVAAGTGAEAGLVAAASRVARALAGRDEAIRSEAGRLLGATTELRTYREEDPRDGLHGDEPERQVVRPGA
ncbi:MAG: LamG domain-containing protein, partial [Planctomycetota bacterium]